MAHNFFLKTSHIYFDGKIILFLTVGDNFSWFSFTEKHLYFVFISKINIPFFDGYKTLC